MGIPTTEIHHSRELVISRQDASSLATPGKLSASEPVLPRTETHSPRLILTWRSSASMGGLSDPGASAARRRGFAQEAGRARLLKGLAGGGGGPPPFQFVIEATEEWRSRALERVNETATAVFRDASRDRPSNKGVVTTAQEAVTAASERYAVAQEAVACEARRRLPSLTRQILASGSDCHQSRAGRRRGCTWERLPSSRTYRHVPTWA